ncbi:hypothetical protein CEUSTIGMA_g8708.t1 [Chlamydomonas eustigma]|uniref:Aspartate aminotransferase n=1 Tax=Chlamydomonas eustigma TaxID=1157962 RepID=A0A250XDZ2_9CHLO|nr:hypothetical protein CEUSTIGMA_g8708.t1 [Chlamydomonas eustigma]|eukprot:GAX81276.1 hypothetical protein CEUSTIGMA_g8708.t1 [Chlamydomonas eustigma]
MTAPKLSAWENIAEAAPDPILSIGDAWRADPDPNKLNLGVGAYRTEEGKPLVLNVVKKAEQEVLADPSSNKEYLPITGNATFSHLSRELAFGRDSIPVKEQRVVTVQALSGTGSLRVGAEFLAAHYSYKIVYIPDPSWPSHRTIFRNAGMEVRPYRYFDSKSRGLDFEGLMADLSSAPKGSVIVLHSCAHNPTGSDPTPQQWKAILEVVQQRQLLPFFDSAYQGFASGDLDEDAASLRMFSAAPGMELLLAQSFAKNMGLYGERVGALSVQCLSKRVATRVEGQLKTVIRPMYSNPPIHGAAIAAKILSDPQLFQEWKVELAGMAGRIKAMRQALYEELQRRKAPGDWTFILRQIGMFSYTGLTREQCEIMTKKHHVYLTMEGRISMAGLGASRAGYLADAIIDAVKTTSAGHSRL